MKKIFGLLMLCMTLVLSSCEQPEGSQSLIGHWKMVDDHWTADFKNNGEMYVSSTKYDTFIPYLYSATSDSLWIKYNAPDDVQEYNCSYHFEMRNILVIDGFDALTPQNDWVTDSIKSKVRTKWVRAKYN
jgi:hypothetical protein